MEPKVDVRERPLLESQANHVDYAYFGNDSNQKIYDEMIIPMIDLALQGGICTVFSYGQTGSGKTFTIQGFLTRIGEDLFKRQLPN